MCWRLETSSGELLNLGIQVEESGFGLTYAAFGDDGSQFWIDFPFLYFGERKI